MEIQTQQSVAKAIEVQRVRSNIPSQAELARRSGFTPSGLNKRLSCDLRMTFDDLDQIATAMGVDSFDLLDAARVERSLAA